MQPYFSTGRYMEFLPNEIEEINKNPGTWFLTVAPENEMRDEKLILSQLSD
jgi:hypothetical protein